VPRAHTDNRTSSQIDRPAGVATHPSARPWSRLGRRLGVPLLAAALAAGAVTVAANPASADIAAQIRASQAQLDALNAKAEAAAERYNAGRIALAVATGKATTAKARLARDEATLTQLRTAAGAFAARAYESGSGGNWAVIVSSPQGPADALDRMAALNRIARTQSDVLDQVAVARHEQAQASADAQAAEAAASASVASLQRDKQTVLAAAQQAQGVLHDLQLKQAAVIKAAKDAAARRAAEARAQALAAQAAAVQAASAAFAATTPAPAPPTPGPAVHYSGSAAQVAVQVAEQQLGKPYQWGAAGPDSFDCSGLTMYAYGKAGISLPHYTGDQYNAGRHVAESDLRPGDLIFFGSDLHHMGMYVGNGQLIHAPHSGDVVRIASLSGWFQDNYAGAVRIAG
jgi:cell wall-associated NlpC family hydrolase